MADRKRKKERVKERKNECVCVWSRRTASDRGRLAETRRIQRVGDKRTTRAGGGGGGPSPVTLFTRHTEDDEARRDIQTAHRTQRQRWLHPERGGRTREQKTKKKTIRNEETKRKRWGAGEAERVAEGSTEHKRKWKEGNQEEKHVCSFFVRHRLLILPSLQVHHFFFST